MLPCYVVIYVYIYIYIYIFIYIFIYGYVCVQCNGNTLHICYCNLGYNIAVIIITLVFFPLFYGGPVYISSQPSLFLPPPPPSPPTTHTPSSIPLIHTPPSYPSSSIHTLSPLLPSHSLTSPYISMTFLIFRIKVLPILIPVPTFFLFFFFFFFFHNVQVPWYDKNSFQVGWCHRYTGLPCLMKIFLDLVFFECYILRITQPDPKYVYACRLLTIYICVCVCMCVWIFVCVCYFSVIYVLLWRHCVIRDDVTNPATMTSLTPLVWRHYPRYYDVTNPDCMTSLTPLVWRHYPRYYDVTKPHYYDVTNPATMTSLTPLLWRH